jgi:hypothetical protein
MIFKKWNVRVAAGLIWLTLGLEDKIMDLIHGRKHAV